MKILLLNNYYHASCIYSRHLRTLNVSNKNVYKLRLKCSLRFIIVLHGGWHCGNNPKDGLPDQEGPQQTKYYYRPTFLHYRASQSRGLPSSNQASITCTQNKTMHFHMCQTHSNFCTFKLCVYLISYTRIFTKLNLFEILF